MLFNETEFKGVYTIDIEKLEDSRGFFARIWCEDQFAAHGVDMRIAQSNVSFSPKMGTLRGLHYQRQPSQEAKLIRCIRGAIYCALVDVRPTSVTFGRAMSIKLSQDDHKSIFVPPMVANGFQTLVDDTEVSYSMSEAFDPRYMQGVRWNDPLFEIQWPMEVSNILERDAQFPDFTAIGDRV